MNSRRNELCPCGSGRKYKLCHGASGTAAPASQDVAAKNPVAVLLKNAIRHHGSGEFAEAEALYREVLARDQRNAQALSRLGALLFQRGQPADAERLLRAAIAARPGLASTHCNLGVILHRQGRTAEAEDMLQRAVALKPDDAVSLGNLGAIQKIRGRIGEAEVTIRRAIAIDPRLADAHSNLGSILMRDRRDEGLACLDRALAINPNFADAHFNRASLLKEQGLIGESIVAWRQTISLAPQLTEAHSNLLLTMHYSDELAAQEIQAEHRRYNAEYAGMIQPVRRDNDNDPDPARRLRIGYVSPDFRQHSVAYFIEPALNCHDASMFEVTCYHTHSHKDEVTARLTQLATRWVDCASMSDEDLARMIANDRIDILIDLAGHTGGRMLTFARKPAPVQATWLGYPASTGLSAMGYRITDANADPPGHDALQSEQLVRLPASYFCYRPADESPLVAPPPVLKRGCTTFGSFNHIAKATGSTIALWAQVLNKVPGSRLLLKAAALADQSVRQRIRDCFSAAGIDAARIDMRGWEQATTAHLTAYGEIDIALDTWPYNGATTTCEALWMGVPVVTLTGERPESRMGASILAAAGCKNWVAADRDQYVAIAARLAAEPGALQALRAAMRETLRGSALLDARGFTRSLETEYRRMWETWCKGQVGVPETG